MRLTTEAFVLSRHPLTESSWIVALFTREAGLVRAVAKGARRTRSPFRGALEPMTRVQAEVVLKEGRDLHALSRADVVEGALDLFGEWPRASVLMAAAEVLGRGLPPQGAEEDTYRLLGAVLGALRAGLEPATAWLYFQAWFLRLHGVLPRADRCGLCAAGLGAAYLDAEVGGWICPSCRAKGTGRPPGLTAGAVRVLERLFAEPPGGLAGQGLPAADTASLRALLRASLASYLGGAVAVEPG